MENASSPAARLLRDELLAFTIPFAPPSRARVRLYDISGAPKVVIVSELADNRGPSVTNAFLTISRTVCETYALDPEAVLWIEHYERDGFGRERYDEVRMQWHEGTPSRISWQRSSAESVGRILGPSFAAATTAESLAPEVSRREPVTESPAKPDGPATDGLAMAEAPSDENVAAGSDADESITAESISAESITADGISGESIAEESITVDGISGESIAEESISEESIAWESVAAEGVRAEGVVLDARSAEEGVATAEDDVPQSAVAELAVIADETPGDEGFAPGDEAAADISTEAAVAPDAKAPVDGYWPFDPNETRARKTYRGIASKNPVRYALAVSDSNGTRPLKYHKAHAPDGFAWASHGSRAGELARCLLVDALKVRPRKGGDAPRIDTVYPQFKRDVIATLPKSAWELGAAKVVKWYETNAG